MSLIGTVLQILHIVFGAFLELRLLSGAVIGWSGGGVLGDAGSDGSAAASDGSAAGAMLLHSAECGTMCGREVGVVGAGGVSVAGTIFSASDDELAQLMLAAEPIELLPAMSWVGSCPPHEPIHNNMIQHVPITPTQFG